MSTLEGADEDCSAGQWVVEAHFSFAFCCADAFARNGTSEAKVGDFVVFTWEGHF